MLTPGTPDPIPLPAVVFDCNLFLQAIGKGGNHAFGCMELVLQGRLKLFMSEACLEEIEDVLRRPEVRQSFPNLTNEKVDEFVALVRIVAEFIDPVPHAYDLPADPDDERYINLAIACGGVFLVSWDKHLRNLANPNHPEGMRFRKAHPTIAVMDPREFLAHYHGKAEVPRKPTR